MPTRPKILIVDDDKDFSQAIATLLQSNGYEVSVAFSGKEGIDKARIEQPNLILLDVMMTDRTEGFFTMQNLRGIPELADTPVIMLSSVYEKLKEFTIAPDTGWLPCDLFLHKPVAPQQLLDEISARVSGQD